MGHSEDNEHRVVGEMSDLILHKFTEDLKDIYVLEGDFDRYMDSWMIKEQ